MPAAELRYIVESERMVTMRMFDEMPIEEQVRFAEIAASYGVTPEHLVAISQGPPNFGRDAGSDAIECRFLERSRTIGSRFSIGESIGVARRP